MRHKKGYRHLGRNSSHRKAMLRNLATSMIKEGKVTTTLPKAKELRRVVEKLITVGKKSHLEDVAKVHKIRQLSSYLMEREAVDKVVNELAVSLKERPGGYTRILKRGVRFGDGAKLATIEFVK